VFYRPGTTDAHLIRSILYQEEYDIDTRGLDPRVILDVGGNAGYASIFFANKFPQARVFSYEPEPDNFEMLRRNTERYTNVTPEHAAIWGSDTTLIPRYDNADAWSFSLKELGESSEKNKWETIQGITVASLLKKTESEVIDIIKIDIEGGELSLFSNDCSWLHKVKILVVELHDRKLKGCSQALYTALVREGIEFTQKNMDYNTIIYNEAYFD
jgi:FkbM family methyltransferase